MTDRGDYPTPMQVRPPVRRIGNKSRRQMPAGNISVATWAGAVGAVNFRIPPVNEDMNGDA